MALSPVQSAIPASRCNRRTGTMSVCSKAAPLTVCFPCCNGIYPMYHLCIISLWCIVVTHYCHCAASGWTKLTAKVCLSHDSKAYPSLDAAKEACAREAACWGIYDGHCDGKGSFSLCHGALELHSVSNEHSCVYKSRTNHCTCKHGISAVGAG